MKKIILIIPILLLLLACEKPVIVNPEPEISLYEQMWETRYLPETYMRHSHPHLYENHIVTASQNSFGNKVDYNIAGFNKFTGDLEWTWSHSDINTKIVKTHGFNSFLLVRAFHKIFLFDIKDKAVLWEIPIGDDLTGIGKPNFNEDFIYMTNTFKVLNGNKTGTSLKKYDLLTGQAQVLYEEITSQIKPYDPSVKAFSTFQVEAGSEYGIFEVGYSSDSVGPRETLPDLVCIDLQTRNILWRRTNYNELTSSHNTIKFHNGKLYNTGDWSLYEFDPESGEELNRWPFWESYPLGSFNTCDFTIVNDVVYTLDDLGHLNGINTITGDFEFSYKKGAANTQSPPTIHNDLILYSSFGHQAIEIFDTKKKAFIHKERNKSFGNDIVYDEETDLHFTTTPYFVHAFRVHDE